jgi:hypothetical protein
MTSHNQTSKNKLLLICFARDGLIIAFHISGDIDLINPVLRNKSMIVYYNIYQLILCDTYGYFMFSIIA